MKKAALEERYRPDLVREVIPQVLPRRETAWTSLGDLGSLSRIMVRLQVGERTSWYAKVAAARQNPSPLALQHQAIDQARAESALGSEIRELQCSRWICASLMVRASHRPGCRTLSGTCLGPPMLAFVD